MFQRITDRKFWQWCRGIALVALALAATGVSGYLNVNYGLQFSLVIAVVFGLSDTALFIIPAAASANGWNRYLRAAFLACALTSVWTAANALFDDQWQHFMVVEHEADRQSDIKDEIERLKRDLASIDEAGSVKSLEAQILAKRKEANAEENRGGCGTECIKDLDKLAKLQGRKGKAERRDELESKLTTARSKLKKAKPVSGADGMEVRAIITTILALLLLETLRHFNMEGLRLIKLAMQKPRQRKRKEAAAPASPPANVVPLHSERVERGLRNLTGT